MPGERDVSGGTGALSAGRPLTASTIASSSSECFAGFIRYALNPSAAARVWPSGDVDEVSMMRRASDKRGLALISRASANPSTSGMSASVTTRPNGCPASDAASMEAIAWGAPSTATTVICQLSSISRTMWRLVALSSTTSTRRPRRSAHSFAAVSAFSEAIPNRAAK